MISLDRGVSLWAFKKLVWSDEKKYLRKEGRAAIENPVSGLLIYKLFRGIKIELKLGSGGKHLTVGIDRQVRLTPVTGCAIVMDVGQVQLVGMKDGGKTCHDSKTEQNQNDAESGEETP